MNDQVSAAAPLMLLNYILQTKDKDLIVENGLTEDFFPNCRKEFNFIKEHIDNYGVVPDKTSFSVAFPDFVLYRLPVQLGATSSNNAFAVSDHSLRQEASTCA